MKFLYKLALCLFLMIMLSSCGSTSINLSDYVTVEFNGIDGYASVEGTISKIKLLEKINSSNTIAVQNFINSVEVKSIESNIKNGDIVNIVFTFSEKDAEQLKLKVNSTEMKVTANGLAKGRLVDAFQEIKVAFTEQGVKITNVSNDPFLRLVNYRVLQSGVMKNGETIEVYADYDERLINEYKVAVTERQKTYTVNGLWELLEDLGSLKKEQKANLLCYRYITEIQNKTDLYSHPAFFAKKGDSLLNGAYSTWSNELLMQNVNFEKAYFVYNPETKMNSLTCVFTVDYYLDEDKTDKQNQGKYLATEHFFITDQNVIWQGKDTNKISGRGDLNYFSVADFQEGYEKAVLNPIIYADGCTIQEYGAEYFI